jgi:hypothetical protein
VWRERTIHAHTHIEININNNNNNNNNNNKINNNHIDVNEYIQACVCDVDTAYET